MFWPAAHRSRRPLSAALLTSVTLVACSPQPDPYKADPVQAIADNRFLRVIHSPDPVPEEEPPPEEQENTDEAVGSGHRHRGEEGKMGRPTARAKSGLYAMKGPKDAIPRYAPSALPAACDGCEAHGADRYQRPADNPWTRVLAEPLSTFSIDVDTASYSNVRRFILGGSLPPAAAVRTEELINYFDYGYAPPSDGRPLAVHAELAPCPWNPTHKLVHVGLKGKVVPPSELGPRNLVFLVDVSGSMESEDKLPLLRAGLRMLVADMKAADRIAIVAYAGASGLVLPPTSGEHKQTILRALDNLAAGGSTNGGAGISLAYAQARKHFIQGGINRVVLASDGDFNVGVTSHDELVSLVEQQRKSGVYLSVLGFGRGNLNDHTMEQLADKGNGNYAYIDSEREATKVLVTEAAGTLVTVARDVKLQVEWNPAAVSAYRLIGYENRMLAAQDFKDDRKDAGELGSGHDVTGIYEVVPAGTPAPGGKLDDLKYQRPVAAPKPGGELLTVKVRYKPEGSDLSSEMQLPVTAADKFGPGSDALRLAAAVAAFGERLRDPGGRDGMSFADIAALAETVQLPDPRGDRKEFIRLVREAAKLLGDVPVKIARLEDDELG